MNERSHLVEVGVPLLGRRELAVPEARSGSSADIDRVKEILRDRGGEAPRAELLAELGERYDIGPDRADNMVTTARTHGATLPPDGDGVVRLTE